jgi:hypothetical protein
MANRQLYPDFLRATSIAKIIVFHFVGWQLLTYLPSLGIMFALAGWFVATSLNAKPWPTVIYQRLVRLLPTWWAYSLFVLIAGFFYAQGTGVDLKPSFAWLFPYERVTWSLTNDYANDATSITWYIAAYLWLMLLSPILLYAYKKLSWVMIFAPVFAMIIYSQVFPTYQETVFGETWYDVLTFSGCWVLGFAKADGTIDSVPKYLVWALTIVCVGCGVFLTYDAQSLPSNPVALSVMSFGIAFLLLSLNPNLEFMSNTAWWGSWSLPYWVRDVVRVVNTYAVTIYLFHNSLVDVANKIGGYLNVYEIGNDIGEDVLSGYIGDWVCFTILIGLIYATAKTIGIVETHKWVRR